MSDRARNRSTMASRAGDIRTCVRSWQGGERGDDHVLRCCCGDGHEEEIVALL